MSDSRSTDVLVRGARALARMDTLRPFLNEVLGELGAATGAGSGAVLVPDEGSGALAIVGSLGLDADTEAGLAAAVRNPGHAVARTFATGETAFDVLPGAPGGPALRSHLPLVVVNEGREEIVGVLALAHDRPIDDAIRPVVVAAADLAAVAIEVSRSRASSTGR